MFKRLAPVLALGLLSGCALTNSEQNHQETLSAINDSNAHLTNRLNNLALSVSNQMDYVESLESEIVYLQEQIEHATITLSQANSPVVAAEEEEEVAPAPASEVSPPTDKIVLGAIERVHIDAINQTFDARIDTGAATSSLNAIDIEYFERNGNNWVRFHLADGVTELTDENWIELPIVRFVKIRQSTSDNVERRAVVELWVRVGKIQEKAQFTLADRSQMSHPILLGREFIRDIALVDISRKYIHTESK
ncbi:ATP-dependent zinc protease [uncultured Vibrio sp.]|uniref:ATP-dependent zinc protease family protein n=1 Tax=uncultured Vibrio sp. TaxID=114054 RepID=UPI0009110913|nr:ATP-dependent zinc protease [uncultured Vibrio sp.]OIQ26707.1 MAG: ATP-dependent Zn protease [Vibrio sp. MedPE-SWchi]